LDRKTADFSPTQQRFAMSAGIAAERLLRELQDPATPFAEGGTEQLRVVVGAYVEEMRNAGFAVEHVIVSIKRLAAEAGLRPPRMPISGRALTSSEQQLADVIRWCVEWYYQPVDVTPPTSSDHGIIPLRPPVSRFGNPGVGDSLDRASSP
jgi:hypothetical protein